MKKLICFSLAIALLFTFAACVSDLDTLDDDEVEILRVAASGKQFLSELQSGVQPSGARFEDENAAAAAFARFIKLDTLFVSGVRLYPDANYDVCIVSGYNEHNYFRSVEVQFLRDEQAGWLCPMVTYAPRCDAVLDAYLGYLRDKDAQGLAAWFREGDTPSAREVEQTKKAIAYYNGFLDLSETTVWEEQSDLLDNGFRFVVKDAKGVTFDVELHYGDGLCYPRLPEDQ